MFARCSAMVLLTGCLLLTLGCGRGGRPIPVSGVLTLEGKALPDARVTFNPVDSAGRMAFGQTDAEGRFQLTTINHNDGAFPGQYKITVNVVGPSRFVDPALATNPDALFRDRERNLKSKPPQVHGNYLTVGKTPLKQDVPADGEVKLDLRKDGT